MLLTLLPLGLDAFYVSLLIGIAFGFVLESSGFGDARRLAAQFYFRESRVVKVMFTAIVTCMLLLVLSSALGLLDVGKLWINPTYLASGIVGGLILGVGFIVGGYCPGTSITSAATLKKDGMLFLGGVGVGSLFFDLTGDSFRTWFDTAGYLGRVTLPEWLGLPVGVVALLIVLMAIGMFVFFDRLEQTIGVRSAQGGAKPAPRPRRRGLWRPAVKGGGVALAAYLLLAMALPALGQPTVADRLRRMAPELDRELADRAPLVEPLEVLGLMHNHVQGQLGRFGLLLLDVRDEPDFNLFHLVDAQAASLADLEGDVGLSLAGAPWQTAIKVVMSNDEARAIQAWKVLRAQGVRDVYVLAGGINGWLDVFRLGREEDASAHEVFRHPFVEALGDRYPASRPPLPVFQQMKAEAATRGVIPWKVAPVVKAAAPSGGCG